MCVVVTDMQLIEMYCLGFFFNPNSLWRRAEISDNRFHASAFWKTSVPPVVSVVGGNFLYLAAGRLASLTAHKHTRQGGVEQESGGFRGVYVVTLCVCKCVAYLSDIPVCSLTTVGNL